MKRWYFIKKFLLYFLIIFLPIAVAGVSFYEYSNRHIQQTINDNAESKYNWNIHDLISILDVFPYQGSLFNNSSAITQVIAKVIDANSLSYSESTYLRILTSIINNYANTRDFIDSIYLYKENDRGNFIRSGYGLSKLESQTHTEWLDIFRRTDSSIQSWISSYTSRYYSFETPHTIISVFYRLDGIGGAVIVNLKEPQLSRMLDSIATYPGEMIFVTDAAGNYLFGNNAAALFRSPENLTALIEQKNSPDGHNFYTVSIDARQYVAMDAADAIFGLHFYSLTAADVLYETPRSFLRFIYIVAGMMALVSLVLSYLITRGNYLRVQNVIAAVDAAEKGDYNVHSPSKEMDEYDIILNNVIDVFIRNSYLRLRVNQLELEKQVAEYRSLQLQINPHFLFNTLQTISMRAMQLDAAGSFAAPVQNLSDILRYSLALSQPKVSLRDEIAMSKKYLAIQAERYPRRFYIIWECDDALLDKCILRLILQPLLENSIQHGILPSTRPGLIKVRIEAVQHVLHVCITDTGIGMSHEDLDALAASVHEDICRGDKHIGLKNVHMRLKLLFGERAYMHFYSLKDQGSSISLAMPLEVVHPAPVEQSLRPVKGIQNPDSSN